MLLYFNLDKLSGHMSMSVISLCGALVEQLRNTYVDLPRVRYISTKWCAKTGNLLIYMYCKDRGKDKNYILCFNLL